MMEQILITLLSSQKKLLMVKTGGLVLQQTIVDLIVLNYVVICLCVYMLFRARARDDAPRVENSS